MTIATVLSAFALLTFMAWTAILVLVVRVGLLPKLGAVDEASSDDSQLLSPPPRVSVIVPAHNEERGIAESLRSLLSMDYQDYEVIFVNDRSIDRTGDIAKEFVAKDKRLKVIHIEELPPGWFGKNHAAWCGAQAASGEIILFTDADVIIAPDALSRAVNYLIGENLQFLGVVPEMIASGALLKASIT
ncbi:MAG: glycosyltransferase family 2 protein, partial [Chloroflexi bacterium]|nr:glycosyltransferase family 2 protein [Chloroflexota bacterium]